MFKFVYNVIHCGIRGLSVIVSIANNKEPQPWMNAEVGKIVTLQITQVGLDLPTPPLPFFQFLEKY